MLSVSYSDMFHVCALVGKTLERSLYSDKLKVYQLYLADSYAT